ncbi:Phenylalanine--tRNA ligase alpha subunit [Planctomycetales bacterium 10988]|nr:Phenylalanine--tRNA ligase alpha subunit [Planctomycetales bacterium 10988]
MSEALDQYINDLQTLAEDAKKAFESAKQKEDLEAHRVEFMGAKNGHLKRLQKGIGKVEKDEKRAAGQKFNEVKQAVEQSFQTAQDRLANLSASEQVGPRFDPTLPGTKRPIGRNHPLTQTVEELKRTMARLGFEVAHGPEIEDEWHNFDALNIPASHPARHPDENFYLANLTQKGHPLLWRSQTSTVQIRVMEKRTPPVRIISLGRVYRPDKPDATHFPMFHQIEGLMVDRGVTMAHLKTTLRLFATSLLGEDVHIRFRPSFFPFTEPSVEVDMSWQGGWLEMGGAGMVDPNVLKAVGYDPDEVSGFAFGLGVERICMRRHNVEDIRSFFENDVRFLHQF